MTPFRVEISRGFRVVIQKLEISKIQKKVVLSRVSSIFNPTLVTIGDLEGRNQKN